MTDSRGSARRTSARRAITVLLGAVLLALGAITACGQPLTGASVATPSCAWNVELSTRTLNDVNVAAPDTAGAYWTLRYAVQPGLRLTVKGHFPDARYFSFNTYDSRFRSFTTNGVTSAIADYQLEPDAGSVNPWRQPSSDSGSYTLGIRADVKAGDVNALPLAPADATDGETGYLILRTYLPAGGAGGVELPTVTFATAAGSRTIAPCTAHNAGELPKAVTDRLPRPGTPLPNQQPSTGFHRINATRMSMFPNVDAAYLVYVLAPLPADNVLVVHGKAPSHPGDDHPAPWPRPGVNVRFLSLCSYPSVFPAPVAHNQMPDGSYDDGCRDDSQTRLDDQGFYTYVVGNESQRARIEAMPSMTFVPISSAHAQQPHFLLFRNLLADSDFKQAVQNVPPGASPDQAAAVMGDHYPRASLCALSVLAVQGISACAS
jgi:hypothetical protein